MTKHKCNFCQKTKDGYKCLLYNKDLSSEGQFISKVKACCDATAGYESNIDNVPQGPTVEPKEIMKLTMELYSKTLRDLLNQGYPQQLAESIAQKHVLGQ